MTIINENRLVEFLNGVQSDGARFLGEGMAPASASAPGFPGQFACDGTNLYVAYAQNEVFNVDTVADVAGSLNGLYWLFSTPWDGVTRTPGVDYYVWYNVDGTGTDPASLNTAAEALERRTGVMVAISADDTDAAVSAATQAAVDAIAGVSAVDNTGDVDVTMDIAGEASDASAGTSGFTVTVTTLGHAWQGIALGVIL